MMGMRGFLLALVALVAACAAQCADRETPERCAELLTRPGCVEFGVRYRCRLSCNVCDSFEIVNAASLTNTAVWYGGNHILTWDRLPFDAIGSGEYVMARRDSSGFRVHALFTRPAGMRTSVTTAVAIKGARDMPRLQISVIPGASAGAVSVGQCRLAYFIDNRRLTDAQVNQLGGFQGIANIRQFEDFFWKMDVRSGARVTMSLRWGEAQGCYFDRIVLRIPNSLKSGMRGLLGTPDNNLYNDWNRVGGATLRVPGRNGRYFQPAYFYSRQWCTRFFVQSIIRYGLNGSFQSNNRCGEDYPGVSNFNGATGEMRAICGYFNYECLQESMSTGLAAEGVDVNRLIEEAEGVSVAFEGLRVAPRAIRSGVPTTIKISVALQRTIPNLFGFGVFRLNEANLVADSTAIFFLTDSGDLTSGDDEAGDRIYSNVDAQVLNNGQSAGYRVVPIINAAYAFDRRDLIFTLPLAVRGYNRASGRDTQVRRSNIFQLERVNSVYIEVKYIWPEDQQDLDTGTSFLDGSVGFACGGGEYVDFTSGDDTSIGGIEKADVRIGEAFTQRAWNAATIIRMHAHWAGSGSGPIVISVVARRRFDDRPIPSTQVNLSVMPPNDFGCAAEKESSRVARLRINRNAAGAFVFNLQPEL